MASDLDAYECLGNPDEPFTLTVKDERQQQDRRRLRESIRCDVAPLSYEQYRAGTPCPGCGRPYLDPEPFEKKCPMHFSDTEHARYNDEEARFKTAHGSCGSHRHGVSGSLTKHCGKCCPMPPLSPTQIDRLGTLLRPATPPHQLMVWRLRLYCGHTVEQIAHSSHKNIHAAFCNAVRCAQCGLDPATIIDARAIGPAEKPPH